MEWVVVGITAVLGLYLAWNIGANDFANAFADAVGSRAIGIKWAVILGVGCEFAGSVLVGGHVTDTVRKGIVSPAAFAAVPEVLALGMMCALVATALWLHLATWFGMPVSTTHSVVGAVAGFGVLAAGWASVEWGRLGEIAASWLLSPVAGATLAYVIFRLFRRSILGRQNPEAAAVRAAPVVVFAVMLVVTFSIFLRGGLERILAKQAAWLGGGGGLVAAVAISLLAAFAAFLCITRRRRVDPERPLVEQLGMVERIFAPLVVLTSCTIAFAHGANDVANAVGPLAAVADIVRTGTVRMRVVVPLWVLALGGLGIVFGLATFGYRVLRTIGTKITEITPSRGVAADVATVTTVLVCSRLKLPVSTTHTIVGAIIGVGLARGLGVVNLRVTRHIFASWLVTVPAAAVLTMVLFALGLSLHAEEAIRQVMGAAR